MDDKERIANLEMRVADLERRLNAAERPAAPQIPAGPWWSPPPCPTIPSFAPPFVVTCGVSHGDTDTLKRN